jgi:cation diffusion facilitator family transporter
MTDNVKEHYTHIRQVLIIVLILNWAVALAKIIYGLFSRCASITADGFHSLSDGASNIIGLVGINLASQPEDKDHPYGHRKYETFFSLGIAALLLLVSFNLFKEGIVRLQSRITPQIDARGFIIMVITMAINIGVMKYEYKKGKFLRSDILVSDSLHTKADIFTSISVIAALAMIKLGHPIMDPIVTMLISLFIAYAGYGIVKESSRVLCDTAVIPNVNKIEEIVLGIDGVKTCHKIRTRGRPDDICIDLHVQVDSAMPMKEAHAICYAIEDAIKRGIPEVSDVLVHVEPRGRTRR